ncbi:hypothetical protein KC799_27530 [candidate division KSB1 bacterium]|nr:hypothetical protein [candidate division KSB1 bacterium]
MAEGIFSILKKIENEIDDFFSSISSAQKYRKIKTRLTNEDLSYELFFSIRYLCDKNFNNIDSKQSLINLGIEEFNEACYIEIIIYYLFIGTLAVQLSIIPFSKKIGLGKALLHNFWVWLELRNKNQTMINQIDELRKLRFEEYEAAYKKIFNHGYEDEWLNGMDILFDVFKTVLPPTKSNKNVFHLLPLLTFFTGTILSFTPIFVKRIDETEIL